MPNHKDDDDVAVARDQQIRPFEWLTSAQSLESKLRETLQGKEHVRVVHIGCGSSVLGEYLVEHFSQVSQVVNVDNDASILDAMEKRWINQCQDDDDNKASKMKFVSVDVCRESIPLPDGSVDLVVDKSTLDCLLCSDKGASSLITEVHRLLNPNDGMYLCISFHHVDLLRPLLVDCPGTDWKFSLSVMYRHVEALGVGGAPQTITNLAEVDMPPEVHSSAWTSKGFQPDQVYHRTVNVLVGRKVGTLSTANTHLDPKAVYEHVNACSDRWYQQHNPMLNPERTHQIRQAFETALGLPECYSKLFTEEEREHLTYEAFLEDWATFLESNPDQPKEEMSSETALRFLSEMQ